MRILKTTEDTALIEMELYPVRCPYCDALLEPEEKAKVCNRCRVIRYKIVDKPIKETNIRKTYPLIDKKETELECLKTSQYVLFEITRKVPRAVTLTVDKNVSKKATAENFKKFLLEADKHLEFIKKKGESRKKKKVFIYCNSLSFEQTVRMLWLKDRRLLSIAFNNYLKTLKGGK